MLVRSFRALRSKTTYATFPRVSLGERKAAPISRKHESELLKLAGGTNYSLRSDFLYVIDVIDMPYTHSSIFEYRHAFPLSPLESPAFFRHHVKADNFRTVERYVESISTIHSRTCLSIGPFVPRPSTSRHISRPGN